MATEVPDEIVDEKSGVHFVPLKPAVPERSGGSERWWKWASLVLSTLLAASVLFGGFGRAFYVTRAEYSERVTSDSVARENMRGTFERLDRTLNAQLEAYRVLTYEVGNLKTDVAVLQKKR